VVGGIGRCHEKCRGKLADGKAKTKEVERIAPKGDPQNVMIEIVTTKQLNPLKNFNEENDCGL
jgi:hypothetical protein